MIERFARGATQPFDPPTLVVATASSAGTGDDAATLLPRLVQLPGKVLISPAAPGCWPPKAIRSISTCMGKSHKKGSFGASAVSSDPEAFPLRSVITTAPGFQDAVPLSSVSAPTTSTSVVKAKFATVASGDQLQRSAWPCAKAASPCHTVPETASQMSGSPDRSSRRRAGSAAAKVRQYATAPVSANRSARRLRTTLGGAI